MERANKGCSGAIVAWTVAIAFFRIVPCKGDAASDPARIVMLTRIENQEGQCRETLASVAANVADVDAEVAAVPVKNLPPLSERSTVTIEHCRTFDADIVFWLQDEHLYICTPRNRGVPLSIRPLTAGDDRIRSHAVGIIIRSALDALASETDAGEMSDQIETGESARPAAVPRIDIGDVTLTSTSLPQGISDAPRLGIYSGYALDTVSTAAPTVQGGRFGVQVHLSSGVHLIGDYTVSQSIEVDTPDVGKLTLKRHPVAVGCLWAVTYRRWRFGAGALFEIDIVAERPVSRDAEVENRGRQNDVQLSLIPELVAGVRIVDSLFFFVNIGVRILPTVPRYYADVAAAGEQTLVYEPWRAQLRLSVGVHATFF